MSQYPFIHYLIDIIGTIGLFIVFPVCCAYLFFSLAKSARRKADYPYARKPKVEDFEKGFSDNTFVDFKVKNKLEYSSN